MKKEKFIEATQINEELLKVKNELLTWQNFQSNDCNTFDRLLSYLGRDDSEIDGIYLPMKHTIIRIINENVAGIVDDLKKKFAELEKQFDEL